MRMDKLTSRFQQALADAQSLAVGRDHNLIEPAHVLVALLDQQGGGSGPLLAQAGVNVPLLRDRLGAILEKLPKVSGQAGQVSLGNDLGRLLNHTDKLAQQHPGVALLKTIPGIGPRTAEALLAYIDDPHRFARIKRVSAYFGLVPSQDASGGTNRLGHITKKGPATVRKLLVEASWRCVDKCPQMRELFERIAGGKKDRRKIALVAVAHKLVRIALSMLKSGEAWDPARLMPEMGPPPPVATSSASGASDPLAISLEPFEHQFRDFAEAIRAKREPAVSGDDGLVALELVDAIYRACRTGGRVVPGVV